MALSKSTQKGQVLKVCDVCEVDTKINWKCFNCNLLMCTKCKDKIHPKFQSTEEHNVVNIKEVGSGSHTRELSFSNIKCITHTKHTCCMFCKTCDSIVCPQCISQVHNGHDLVEISAGYELKVVKLKEVQKQIKVNTDELTDEKAKMNDVLKSRNSQYENAKSKILLQEQNLKETVHNLTIKFVKELDEEWKLCQRSIKTDSSIVDSLTRRLNDKSNEIEELICSDDPKTLLSKNNEEFTKQLEEIMTREILEMSPPLPAFVSGVVVSKNIGSFHREIKICVTAQFDTFDLKKVSRLSVCPDESLWISDGILVLKVKISGNRMQNILRTTCENENMTGTSKGVLLAINDAFELAEIDNTTGRISNSEIKICPYVCTAVHGTEHNTVIVGGSYSSPTERFKETGERALVSIDMRTKKETTLKLGANNERLFTHVSAICTTKCGDVCVVDLLSEEGIGRVLVLSPEDRNGPINIYNGHPNKNDGMKPFKPSSIVSTPMDNIIVSEAEHHAFHVLNSYGNLVQYINTKELGLLNPRPLAFSKSGHLYVGCAGQGENNAKLFELTISE